MITAPFDFKPSQHFVVMAGSLPNCDLCGLFSPDKKSPARFDALSRVERRWGYFCVEHAQSHITHLGTGVGQMLLTQGEYALCQYDPDNFKRFMKDRKIRTPEGGFVAV